ncbi:E4.1 [Bearded dragon adenovirus 1]|uniref:E4.1 n=1 Tax=Bearded dragon adenovirus 1 TaxID=2729647 RepID=A0A6N3IR74_9ADEN|nr:E4.1 [Bearded dragon adenovirus 1]QJR83107.1 E4.1 [Bearded dragon adenovirus 1]QPN96226.1 E4.1 [Bearded dragon adenovirus 1]
MAERVNVPFDLFPPVGTDPLDTITRGQVIFDALRLVDWNCHKIYAVVGAENIRGLAAGPFSMVFRLAGDRTAYVVTRTDYAFSFCPLHYFSYLFSVRPASGLASVEIEVEKILGYLDDRRQDIAWCLSVPPDRTHRCWSLFNTYWNEREDFWFQ